MDDTVTSAVDCPLPGFFKISPDEFIGISETINRLKVAARVVAARPSTIMLLGETGSGKEMMARYIHRHSTRAANPFIPVDCSALSESLFESQLFGHVKGSFTGAVRNTLGFVRAADGGTLFLDEIGELPLSLQVKLLRVLQERCFVPVGDTQPIAVDLRVICATNRDLRGMVADGQFRQDLFFRLNVIALTVPPLRDRADDIVPLSEFFLARQAELAGEPCKRLSEHAAESLARYPWPGNIRELFNTLEHAHILSEGPIIQLSDLPAPLNNFGFLGRSDPHDLNLASLERRAILEALKRTRFNRAAACRILGIEKRRLNRRIAVLKIALPWKAIQAEKDSE
jgi:transcriptional regulator with PAS, ATPase and Fis domain